MQPDNQNSRIACPSGLSPIRKTKNQQITIAFLSEIDSSTNTFSAA